MKKKKQKRTIIIVSIIIVFAVIIYFKFFKEETIFRTKKNEEAEQEETTTVKMSADPFDPFMVLAKGYEGETVAYLQKAINRLLNLEGKPTISVDGDFGLKTETALQTVADTKSTTYYATRELVKLKFAQAGKPNPYLLNSNDGGADNNPYTFV